MFRHKRLRLSKPSAPRLPGIPREPRGWGRTEVSVLPRGARVAERFQVEEPAGEPPAWWRERYPSGTKPEWAVFWALLQLGFQPDEDFFYLAVVPGVGRTFYSQVDFLLPDFSLGIEVQGIYWHYTLGSRRQERDVFRVAYLTQRGLRIIFIDEDDALRDPLYYVKEALAGNDHSKMVRRI